MASLRAEADAAVERAETAEAKNKKLEQELLAKEQENASLKHRLEVVEAELDQTEANVKTLKTQNQQGESDKMTTENLTRKVQLLEEELDSAEKNVKETMEK